MQKTVEKVFDPDTLFQGQKFVYTNRGRGPKGMYHVVKEIEDRDSSEWYTSLCGNSTSLGNAKSLAETVKNRKHGHDHPRQLITCKRCRQIFESRTGRKPRDDMDKYERGEE